MFNSSSTDAFVLKSVATSCFSNAFINFPFKNDSCSHQGAVNNKFTEDRGLLTAFPQNLLAPPDIIAPIRREQQREFIKTSTYSNFEERLTPRESSLLMIHQPTSKIRIRECFEAILAKSVRVGESTRRPSALSQEAVSPTTHFFVRQWQESENSVKLKIHPASGEGSEL